MDWTDLALLRVASERRVGSPPSSLLDGLHLPPAVKEVVRGAAVSELVEDERRKLQQLARVLERGAELVGPEVAEEEEVARAAPG